MLPIDVWILFRPNFRVQLKREACVMRPFFFFFFWAIRERETKKKSQRKRKGNIMKWVILEIQIILYKKFTNYWYSEWLLINEKNDVNGEPR